MKNEVLVALQNLKKSLIKWRVIAIVAVFILIIASNSGKFFKNKDNENSIYRITLDSIILNGMFEEEKIQKIIDNDNIKGVVIKCNSAGGDIVESEKMYNWLRKIAIKKPTIVSIEGVCASGAYLISLASDYIISYNTSIVGSIGVIVEAYEITEMAKKMGINLTIYKSSTLKSGLNPLEKISPDVDMVVSQQINDIYDYFLNIFIERRKIKLSDAQEIANGQTYTGRQSLDFGLIDKIGGTDEIKEYFKLNNIDYDSLNIVDYDIRKDEYSRYGFFGKASKVLSQIISSGSLAKENIKLQIN